MTISDRCDNSNSLWVGICYDNINDLYEDDDSIFHMKYTLLIYVIYSFLAIRYTKTIRGLLNVDIFSVGILIIMIRLHYSHSHSEMCRFPRWCHEGLNDNIIENSYLYRMDECPKYGSWLVYYYEEIKDYPINTNCKDSPYGCCRVNNTSCDTVIREGDSYSFYQLLLERKTAWSTQIEKIDETGSNCPTIEQMIYEVSSNVTIIDIKNEIYLFIIFVIYINIHVLLDRAEEKEISQTDSDDSDDSDDESGCFHRLCSISSSRMAPLEEHKPLNDNDNDSGDIEENTAAAEDSGNGKDSGNAGNAGNAVNAGDIENNTSADKDNMYDKPSVFGSRYKENTSEGDNHIVIGLKYPSRRKENTSEGEKPVWIIREKV